MVKRPDAENYREPDQPRFAADYADDAYDFRGELKVVSWNIKYARKIGTAIAELTAVAELRDAGILLLQEMDETGVESIARTLRYNYVYYPASIQRRTGRKFGNAILARCPISSTGKLQLPHLSPRTGEIRIATYALVAPGGSELLIYSVHTETFALDAVSRREQFHVLAEDVQRCNRSRVLVGGDFNTLKAKDVRALEQRFAEAGLERASAGGGHTQKTGFIGFKLDHIFTRGMTAIDGGVWRGTKASDHYPVWQLFSLD